ncbi:MAG: hypothetical protein K2J71_06885 [Oscillospiraceae bacterium]|nr:hypothetical protein [Oscillospiraceae bacterium]
MIRLQVCPEEIQIEMRGSDHAILSELSDAIFRMLKAMEHSEGRPVSENLTALILRLLEMQEMNS